MSLRSIKEIHKLPRGQLYIIYVEKNGEIIKYRYVYNGYNWNKDEWIRLDHKPKEPVIYTYAEELRLFNMS